MNDPIEKDLLEEFTHNMLECVKNNLENGKNVADVLSIILSVNISCAFRTMLFITKDIPKAHKEVKRFIDNVSRYISEQDMVKKITTNYPEEIS